VIIAPILYPERVLYELGNYSDAVEIAVVRRDAIEAITSFKEIHNATPSNLRRVYQEVVDDYEKSSGT